MVWALFAVPARGQSPRTVALDLSSGRGEIVVGESLQLTATATLDDGSTLDVTATASGTFYDSTDPATVAIDENGLLTAVSTSVRCPDCFQSVTVIAIRVEEGEIFEDSLILEIADQDLDADGLADGWEGTHGLDPSNPLDGAGDPDSDGLSNLEEFAAGSDPHLADTDGDGVADGLEVQRGSSPANPNESFVLDSRCTVSVLNRVAQVQPGGGFAIRNIPVSQGPVRARFVCELPDEVLTASSDFSTPVPNGITSFASIELTDASSIPLELEITASLTTLTPASTTAQLQVDGILLTGGRRDLTPAGSGTTYLSSNPAIASVGPDGLVTAVSSGRVLITATNEGVIATLEIGVLFSDDADGDGLPDDFEALNSLNPGGSNLARVPGALVNVSSASAGFPAERAADGNPQTSWFTAPGDAANRRAAPFVEVVLPAAAGVAQVRLRGNRQNAEGFDFVAGVFQAFDAAGNELVSSGEVVLPAPSRDVAVPIDADGVRRVRFTSTADESNTPGLSEIELIARPGGAALDPGDPADADADFDQDGLTNRQEFENGTSIFLNDTDADGVLDDEEVALGSNPLLADSDADGLLDGFEVDPTGDFDGDGLANVVDPDADGDGVPDGAEVRLGLDPLATDSDGDGIPDGSEDDDADGLPNSEEVLENTDPTDPDSDGDGLLDGEEVVSGTDGFVTDPLRRDSDGDGMNDGFESVFGLDPLDPGDASLDPDGDGLTNLEEFERRTDPFNPDTVPPQVVDTTPAAGGADHPVNAAAVVRFSEPLLAASILPGVVRLFEGPAAVPGDVELSGDGLSVSFMPAFQLTPLTLHTLRVSAVRDRAGNLLAGTFESTFTTGEFLDVEPPEVVHTAPSSGQTEVPPNVPVTAEFSERMDPATLIASNWTVRDDLTFQDVAGTIQVEADGRTAFFVPERPFAVGRRHSVTLSASIADVAGNGLVFGRFFSFTTALRTDVDRPALLAVSPPDGAAVVPVNAVVVLDFSEPLSEIAARRGIAIRAGGAPVEGSFALSNGNRRVTFTSLGALPPNATHTVSVTTAVTDLVGFPLDNPGSTVFTTGETSDTANPRVDAVDPADDARDVPTDAMVTVRFSEPVNPLTVTPASFFVEEISDYYGTLRTIPGAIMVAANGLSASWAPAEILMPQTQFRVRVLGAVQDFAGRPLASFISDFSTGGGADAEPPEVTLVSPPDGAAGVPVNARVVARLDEPASLTFFGGDEVSVAAGGVPVDGTAELSMDRREVTFTPASPLAPSTAYTVAVAGLADLAGNLQVPFASAFATGPSATADTAGPQVTAVSPASGAAGVAVGTAIVLTFDEAVDPTSISRETVKITVDGFAGVVPGTFAVSGATVTFTPLAPLPGGARVRPQLDYYGEVRDLAGNRAAPFASFFDTAATADLTPPEVVLVTPADGAAGVGTAAEVVLTFSEPINAATVTPATVALLADGAPVFASRSLSSDNRTLVLGGSFFNANLPAATGIAVVATAGIEDLSGNRLIDFQSRFTTASGVDAARPRVLSQRPANGGSDAPLDRGVVVIVDELLDPATVPDALVVAQDGVPLAGTAAVTAGGRAAEFRPAAPLAPDALIEVFLADTARDLAGNRLQPHQGSFRTRSDTSGRPPTVVRSHPAAYYLDVVPTNVAIAVEWSEPLDPATVDGNTVTLQQDYYGTPVPAAVSLSADGRVVRITPQANLDPDMAYSATLTTGLRDLDGDAPAFDFRQAFQTGGGADPAAPSVLAITPQDGTAGVPLNLQVRVRFDEAVNPLTATPSTIVLSDGVSALVPCTIAFSSDHAEAFLTPHAVLEPATVYSVAVDGVEDGAGNPVAPAAVTFTTGDAIDVAGSRVARTSPEDGALDVPVTAPVTVELDEPVDPATVDAATFEVVDGVTGEAVAGTVSVSVDGRVLSFVPDAPYAVGRRHTVRLSNVRDLAGNPSSFFASSFTTAFAGDGAPPRVLATTPAGGQLDVPVNVRVTVAFDEPVQAFSAAAVTLAAGGAEVDVLRRFEDGNRRLVLTPRVPLAGSTEHTLTVAGVLDVAGNALAGPSTFTFTTAPGADLVNPAVLALDPGVGHARDVPTNLVPRVAFSEPVDPLTVTPASFFVETSGGPAVRLAGTVTVAPDRRSARLDLDAPLRSQTVHHVQVTSAVRDLAGHPVPGRSATFTTGDGSDFGPPGIGAVSPPDLAAGVPSNAPVRLRFTEPVSAVGLLAARVELAAGGPPVETALTVEPDGTAATLTPASPLAPSTDYTITVDLVEDLAGNAMAAPFAATFTTAAGAGADLASPQVTAVSPPNAAAGVPLDATVTLTFDEPLDPTSVGAATVPVRLSSPPIPVPGTYGVAGSTVTFLPSSPWPGASRVTVQVQGVRDLAGNPGFFSSFFDTEAGSADTTPPEAILVTPADGAVDVGLAAEVVVTFSEPINAATVTASTLGLFEGSEAIPGNSPMLSADQRTVTFNAFYYGVLPPATEITVAGTGGVEDLAGNPLVPFTRRFTTVSEVDAGRPRVVSQRPENGSSGVAIDAAVVLHVDEPLDPSTVPGALVVAEDGVPVAGTVEVAGGGRALDFLPDLPFSPDALVEVFLTADARDLSGNPLQPWQASFRTLPDPAAAAPFVVRSHPASYAYYGETPLNTTVAIEWSEPLDPATVDTATVSLVDDYYGTPLAIAVQLTGGGRVIRIEPQAALQANMTYTYRVTTGVRDLDGAGPASSFQASFQTAASEDLDAPVLETVSPPGGVPAVPVNARVHLRFSEEINPLTATPAALALAEAGGPPLAATVTVSNDHRDVFLAPQATLAASTLHRLTLDGIEDGAGHPVPPATIEWTTGGELDLEPPRVTRSDPASGATGVPLNAVLRVDVDEPVDAGTVTGTTFRVSAGAEVAGTRSVSADGRTLSFVPDAPWAADTTHSVSVLGVLDFAGSSLTEGHYGGFGSTFRTSASADVTAPQITGHGPADGVVEVPTNVRVVVTFDEPVAGRSIDGVRLEAGGVEVPAARTLEDAHRRLVLRPASLLAPSTVHTLTVDGVRDLAENPLAAPRVATFTTGAEPDLERPRVLAVDPANGAAGVDPGAAVTVTFDGPVEASSVTPATLPITRNATGEVFDGAYAVAGDTVTFTPASPWPAGEAIRVRVLSTVLDLAGNPSSSFTSTFTVAP